MHSPSTSSLEMVVSLLTRCVRRRNAHLQAWSSGQSSLQLHKGTANLITDSWASVMVVNWFVRTCSCASGFCCSGSGCSCVLTAPTQSREKSSVAVSSSTISTANHDDYWLIAME